METHEIPLHLANWLSLELSQLPFHQTDVVLNSSNYRFANSMVLSSLNPEYFTGYKPIVFELKDYMLKEMGVHMSLNFCSEVTDSVITALTIFICLHSENKNAYISRIISQLSESDQQDIMEDIKKVEQQLERMKINEQFWKVVADLEQENTKMSKQVRSLEEKYRLCEIEKIEVIHERDQIVIEKRKILSKFKLSNMAQYEELCEQLRIENEENYDNFKEIQKMIHSLNEQKDQLENVLKARENALCELTAEFNELKSNYSQCLMELEGYQSNLTENFSNLCSKMYKSLESTVDRTIQDTLQDARDLQNFASSDGFCASSSGFSFCKTGSSRASTQQIFRMTKTNLTLCEKLHGFEEQNEQLKMKIFSMQDELKEAQIRDKKKLNKLRKVEKLFDPFWNKCQDIMQKQNSGFSSEIGKKTIK